MGEKKNVYMYVLCNRKKKLYWGNNRKFFLKSETRSEANSFSIILNIANFISIKHNLLYYLNIVHLNFTECSSFVYI